MRWPSCSNHAPGNGDRPRMCAATSAAGRVQSIRASAGVTFAAIGGSLLRLLSSASAVAAFEAREPLDHQSRAERARRSCTSPVVSLSLIGVVAVSMTGPVSRPDIHLHHLHAGDRVARHHGAMDRRGAPPARQDGAVQVETAEARRVEDRARQQQAVGDNDGHIELQRRERVAILLRLEVQRGADRRCRAARRLRAPLSA